MSVTINHQTNSLSNSTSTSNLTINRALLNMGYTEEVYTIVNIFGNHDLDPSDGSVQVWSLGSNKTPTASNFAAGQSMTLMIDDGSAYTITWPSVVWVGGTAPTLATTGYTVIELWKVGTTLYGALVGSVA